MAVPTGRRAPYKDFLQPALHRRFASTATILLAIAYVEALILSSWNSYLWSWFPIGPAGVRTFFLFLCGLLVIVLRIAQYHVGIRTSNSAFHTFKQNLVRFSTYETLLWYCLSSAVFFLPVFLHAYSDSTDLHWIVYKAGDRPRLNEKPLFVAYYLLSCGIVQAVGHLYNDEDKLTLGGTTPPSEGSKNAPGDASSALSQALGKMPKVFVEAAAKSLITFGVHVLLYFTIFRSFGWGWTLFFFRPFYSLPKTNMLPPFTPLSFYTMKSCMFGGWLLFVIWRSGNALFSTFMVKEPLKNGKPLTADSKDPNGSLLNGLKSKRPAIRSYAMWELAYIARDFEARRKAIFEDIDRKDGPVWSQIYAICLDLVKSISTRVDEYGKAPTVPTAQKEEARTRVSAPPKGNDIFQSQPAPKSMRAEAEKALDHMARSPGETPLSRLSPMAKKTLKKARDRVLTKDQQTALQPNNVMGLVQQLFMRLLQINLIGSFFRQEYRRRLTGATLGMPEAELSLYVNSINVLSQFAVNSLGEDKFGNVHRDVPTIIRTFTSTIKKLDAFKVSFPVHWTDTMADKETPEVDMVLDAMRTGLGQLVQAFEPYRNDLRLTLTDIRLAKEAAQLEEKKDDKSQEMQQVR